MPKGKPNKTSDLETRVAALEEAVRLLTAQADPQNKVTNLPQPVPRDLKETMIGRTLVFLPTKKK